MSRVPRRILWLLVGIALALLLAGCANADPTTVADDTDVVGHLDVRYATQYDVAFRSDGTSLLTIGDSDRYLLVPWEQLEAAGNEAQAQQRDGVTIVPYPLRDAYVAASSTMDYFRQLGTLDHVRMTSTKAQDWSLPEVVSALDKGEMCYVGKYSAPDYELVLSGNPSVAIESTMIYHAPEVAERLSALGIPVMVDRSSYETSPLGRLEWIKLYGLLSGQLDEAEAFFDEQVSTVEGMTDSSTADRPRVAFFSIAANGHVTVRKPGDYVSQMIDLAGGTYFLSDGAQDETALSTMSMEMESFYEQAHDVDIVLYNSAIDDELASIDELVAKSPRLADFAAVRNGNVWCTGKDLYQQPTCLAQMVQEMAAVFRGTTDDSLEHLYRVDWVERT